MYFALPSLNIEAILLSGDIREGRDGVFSSEQQFRLLQHIRTSLISHVGSVDEEIQVHKSFCWHNEGDQTSWVPSILCLVCAWICVFCVVYLSFYGNSFGGHHTDLNFPMHS